MNVMTETKTKILIAEDERSLRTILKKLLEKKGFLVDAVGDGELALSKLRETNYALAILDIKMPSRSGLEILSAIKKEKPQQYILIMTAQDTMRNAIDAMKKGAYDYITKPFELEDLELIVEKALSARRLSEKVEPLEASLPKSLDQDVKIIGSSKVVQEIYKTIGRVAESDVSILITGESGTGKELVARAIHQHSTRSAQAFIAVNCAAIPRDLLESELFGYRKGAFTGADSNRAGFFEMANHGTLFLDEIGDLPLSLQGKLLRILQEKEVQRLGDTKSKPIDVRILAATNQKLAQLVKAKQFREDLFFRLNVIPFELPPLRERSEDIPRLCEYFLKRFSEEMNFSPKSITPEALKILQQYTWPGNIRELENVVKRAALLSSNENLNLSDFSFFLGKQEEVTDDQIESLGLETLIEKKLQSFLHKTHPLGMNELYDTIMPMAERPLLKLILKQTGYNQIQAAKILGMNRNTLRKKIRTLGIRLKDDLA